MPVPKRKTSKAKRDSRRANHDKTSLPSRATCSRCGAIKVPHHVCGECGYYKNRQVVVTEGVT